MRAEALVQGHDVSAAIERFKKTSDEISSDRFVAQERYMELLTVTNKLLVASESMLFNFKCGDFIVKLN